MTLQVDTRAGSESLIAPLTERGLQVMPSVLEYGDFAWVGQGPGGRPVTVGVELKTVQDVLACITSGRFAGHQLPGLQQAYEVVYLLVEGDYRVGHERQLLLRQYGKLQEIPWGARQWKYDSLDSWLTTLEIKAGVRVRRSIDSRETAQIIHDLYAWWTMSEFESHRSHLVTYLGNDMTDRVWTLEASTCARGLMAMVKGLGEKRARAVAAKYGSMRVVAGTGAAAIAAEVEGIGPKLAESIVKALWSDR